MITTIAYSHYCREGGGPPKVYVASSEIQYWPFPRLLQSSFLVGFIIQGCSNS